MLNIVDLFPTRFKVKTFRTNQRPLQESGQVAFGESADFGDTRNGVSSPEKFTLNVTLGDLWTKPRIQSRSAMGNACRLWDFFRPLDPRESESRRLREWRGRI
jgi:hypothetical protein